ncbi:MAG: hypothetical protein JF617_15455, partial [Burkholderiales bacterium]|nr:hypothetical protein [Burkholderiales bacterium]
LMTRLGVKSMAHLGDGFVTGPEPRPLRIAPDLLVQPLICYESLFPRLAKPVPGVRAIVNVSNDAWFGVTSGPLQHLNLASYRAIETGLPMIRATPTGVGIGRSRCCFCFHLPPRFASQGVGAWKKSQTETDRLPDFPWLFSQ